MRKVKKLPIVGDMKILPLSNELMLLESSKIIDCEIRFILEENGFIEITGTIRIKRNKKSFKQVFDIKLVESITTRELHNLIAREESLS
ncbi:hypothetical protein ACM26V_09250 [Salipaludibacillus sp. HK11]|uniref:hypothetical protein n=1 Tax=Salipaludibacillus sp. HK11 TaxID=3394320 RepID=UPI0039FD6BB8